MKRKRKWIVAGLIETSAGVVLVLLLWPRPPELYQVTILPSLGGKYTTAYAINDRGQVAGISRPAGAARLVGGPRRVAGLEHLFLWDRDNGMRDLGPVVHDSVQINEAGQIVATMRDPNGHNRAFIWDPDTGRHILPTLGGDDAEASALNNLGQVIGLAHTASGRRHAFVWDLNHGIRDLTPSARKPVRAFSINDAGQILTLNETGLPLISIRDGQMSPLPRPPLRFACDINNDGAVVGLSRRIKDTVDVEVWHPESGTTKVGQLKGGTPGTPKINDAGQVFFWRRGKPGFKVFGLGVLSTSDANFLWDPGQGVIALDACVPLGRGDRMTLIDMNNYGALVGVVHRRGGRSEAILLEPIRERWGRRSEAED